MVIPGTVIELEDACTVHHPIPDAELRAIFTDKRAYLEAYRERKRPVIEAERAVWPQGSIDLITSLAARIEPLLSIADHTCAGINARVLIICSTARIVIDFIARRVYSWTDEPCAYRFWIDPRLLEHCILFESDWVNSLFLSCRFEAERDGPYNEYVYNFFKCLTLERLQYAEGYYAEESDADELLVMGDHLIQRRCPHLKADLARFGRLEDGILTCSMHGWQFDIDTGNCLTSTDRRLYTRRIQDASSADE